MEAISSLAAILQLLGNAAIAATQAAKFISNVRNAPKTQHDLQVKLDFLTRTVAYLTARLDSRRIPRNGGGGSIGGVSNISNELNCRQEEEEIWQMARDISADCMACASRLEELTMNKGNDSLPSRVKGQIVQEIRKPEIQRIEAKIQANVGNIQLLLSCLKLFVDDDQVARGERIERHLLDIREQYQGLEMLRDHIVSSLRHVLSNGRHAEHDGQRSSQTHSWLITTSSDQDGHEWMQTTDRALRTADSLMDKLSRSGSEPSQASHEIESLSSTGEITIMLEHPLDITPFISPLPLKSPGLTIEAPRLSLDLMTTILDENIIQAKQESEQGRYDECERSLHRAIQYGENRYQHHKQVFEQWFDLQIWLAEVYQMQGKLSEAQSLLAELNQSTAENGPEYCKITPLRRAQLYHAQARFCLYRYDKYHDITLPSLNEVAQTSYTAVEDLVNKNNAESFPDTHLAYLAKACAEIWSEVADLSNDKALSKVLRERHSSLNSNKNDNPLPQAIPMRVPRRHRASTSSAYLAHQSIISSSPSERGMSDTQGPPSETAATETSRVLTQSLCAATEEGYESLSIHMNRPHVDVEERNPSGLTPLLIASKRSDLRCIDLLLRHFSADVNAQDNHGMNALHHLLRGKVSCDDEIIKLLLSRNIDVNAANLADGEMPLHYCVRFKHFEAASLLLKSGRVDIEATNAKNQTAATLAASNNGPFTIPILKLLSDYDAKFDTAAIPRGMLSFVESLKRGQEQRRRRSLQSSQGEAPSVGHRLSSQSSRASRKSTRWSVFSTRSN
ncbi:hypothetical protein BGW36DRAFT_451776 [Talaromyces proteolyticus]|uniref:Fungal N-terminal domain-containing protein n=1 Tax=Talaromyces proteolyticus TaxID=1131652 RepID=A0AAD4KTS1_9EURO|nr:uncharacterized protein BGW36DRAFT_451776 [Talaromyces proteolyticus]KAH8696401.1 hypothetical protein BGW36DRAFT_451776 [Talaromyces proteolyticus]